MDADTRHQLKQNEFAEALGKLRDFTDARFWYWVVGIVVIVGVYTGYRLWQRQQAAELTDTWAQLLAIEPTTADDESAALDRLRALANDNSDPRLVAAARLRLGGALCSAALEKPARRAALLREAETVFDAVRNAPQAPLPLVAAATFALGTVYESQQRIADARRVFQVLTDDARFAGLPYEELAASRLETLEDLAVKVDFEPGDPPPPASRPAAGPAAAAGPPASAPAESRPATAPQTRPSAGQRPGTPGQAASQPAGAPAPAQPSSRASSDQRQP